MTFLPKYIAAAIVGTIAVYVGSPFAMPGDGQVPGDGDQVAELPEVLTFDQADRPPARPIARPASRRIGQPTGRRTATPPPPADPAGEGQAPAGEDAPEVIVENVRGYTPSTERIRASGNDVKYWGVTIVDASFYDRDGKLREERLPGGTLIEQTGAKGSSKGEVAICRIWRNGQWAGSYLVSTADLIRFDGGREEVDADDVDNLCKYYSLNAKAENRKKELAQKAAFANPHFAELKRKATAYNEHRKRAEELTAKRDGATGAERSKIIAELTQLKNAEAREAAEVQSLTRKYEEWKKNHPNAGAANPEADPAYRDYLGKLSELRPKLAVFGI